MLYDFLERDFWTKEVDGPLGDDALVVFVYNLQSGYISAVRYIENKGGASYGLCHCYREQWSMCAVVTNRAEVVFGVDGFAKLYFRWRRLLLNLSQR